MLNGHKIFHCMTAQHAANVLHEQTKDSFKLTLYVGRYGRQPHRATVVMLISIHIKANYKSWHKIYNKYAKRKVKITFTR